MILVPHEELGEAFINLWFIDDKCPNCKYRWTKDDDMQQAQIVRDRGWLVAYHRECLKIAHPDLCEAVNHET